MSTKFSFDTRLANAIVLHGRLASFTNYQPPWSALSVPALEVMIGDIGRLNGEINEKTQQYTQLAAIRKQIFSRDADSLSRILSPVAAAIRSVFGKTSPQAGAINALVIHIRGLVLPGRAHATTHARSYGQMADTFGNIITLLYSFGENYAPANIAISLPALVQKHEALVAANETATRAANELQYTRNERAAAYIELSNITQRIKEAVKSQYGIRSEAYTQVKSLKI